MEDAGKITCGFRMRLVPGRRTGAHLRRPVRRRGRERERAVRFFVLIGLGLDGHFKEAVWLASSPSEIHFFSKQELCLSITVETRKQVPVQGALLGLLLKFWHIKVLPS